MNQLFAALIVTASVLSFSSYANEDLPFVVASESSCEEIQNLFTDYDRILVARKPNRDPVVHYRGASSCPRGMESIPTYEKTLTGWCYLNFTCDHVPTGP